MYTDSPSYASPVSQKAKLPPLPVTVHTAKRIRATTLRRRSRRPERKYTSASASSTPENSRKVTAVPTAGMVTKVGRKVPRMLPTVLQAPSRPTVRPPSSRLSTVYLTSEGVTVPSKKSGKTKSTMHAQKAARVRKWVLTDRMSTPEMPRIT